MQAKQTHWASLSILFIIGMGILFLLTLTVTLALASFISLFGGTGNAAAEMISSFSFGFLTLLLLACGWFVLEKARGVAAADQPYQFPLPVWLMAVIPIVTVFSILFGGLATLAELPWLNWITLPVLTLLVIIPPIWLLFGIAAYGLDLGPRWRFFSVLSMSLTVSPVIMIFLEIFILVGMLAAGAIYAAIAQPEVVGELETLAGLMNENMSEEAMFALIAPYVTNPAVIAFGIGYIALLVPLIEELFKPLAVWLIGRRLESPAQGFALGALSGAAFALFESLNASADGTMSWAVIVTARTGTSVLHMLTSGLVGWGIASAVTQRRFGRLFAAYGAAVLIHGIWNAAAAGLGIAALGESVGKPEWLFNVAPALACGLMTLGTGVIALLFAFNRRLRKDFAAKTEAVDLLAKSGDKI